MDAARWVPASRGFVPDGAAVACTNFRGSVCCVARAWHNGCVIPGKLMAGLQQCIVTWRGKTIMKNEYEVLCNARESWQLMDAGTPIPSNALPIGTTEDEGVLFVGRVHMHSALTILGKVVSKDSKCYVYVPAEKREIGFSEFEIMTVPPACYHALTNRGTQGNSFDAPNQSFAPNNMSSLHNNMPYYTANNNSVPYLPSSNYYPNAAALHPSFDDTPFPNYDDGPQQASSYQNNGAIPKSFSTLNAKKKRNSKKDNGGSSSASDRNTQMVHSCENQQSNVTAKQQKVTQECCHLAEVEFLFLECWDTTSACDRCSDSKPGHNWECLHCREVLCRGSNQHMMSHALKTSHFVCISQQDLAVWCFKCDTLLGAKNMIQALNSKVDKREIQDTQQTNVPPKQVEFAEADTGAVQQQMTAEKKDETKLGAANWVSKMFSLGADKQKENNVQYVPVPIPLSLSQKLWSRLELPQAKEKEKPCWVQCNGSYVPNGALSGGTNHQGKVYVARVEQNGALIPGKFIPNYKRCYASSNGREILEKQFEVLCHVDAEWVTVEETLPSKAVQGGHDKDFKPLYIGRLKQPDNTLVLGKVEQVAGVCKFFYLLKRKEHCSTSEFEVLVSEEKVPVRSNFKSAVKRPVPTPRSYTPRTRPQDTQPPAGAARISWVTQRDGNIATGAVVGGTNHKGNVYVVRAEHNGEIIPGKLIPSFKSAYIAFNGGEVRKREYQVLCESNTDWRAVNTGDEIPSNAIPAGFSAEDQISYVGRVRNGNRVAIGKVDDQSKACVALQDGKEITFSAFEILVSTAHDTESLSRAAANLPKELKTLLSPQPEAGTSATASKPDVSTRQKKEKVFKLQELVSTDQEYNYVRSKMKTTSTNNKINIVKIEKITNSELWDRYSHYCEKIKGENDGKINERRLFHGSSNCKVIAKEGFDERFAKPSGNMFGAGLYFAEHCEKSRGYANGTMLLCKVALGKMSKHTSAVNFSHPPQGHHSVKGCPGTLNFPEYIVYRGEQALPVYLITYT